MDNHLHLLLRIDCEVAESWSDQEVVERWFRLYPPRGADRKPMKPTEEMVLAKLNNSDWVRETRGRLSSLGWFMKCLKEPLARLANRQDGCTGAFFEGRFKSIAILDQESLLSVAAYIDLNPVRAGLVTNPSLYRWSGYGQAMAGRPEALAGYQSLTAIRSLKPAQALKHYRAGLFDYAERRGVFPPAQACIKPDIKRRSPQTLHPWQQHGDFGLIGQLLHRIRYFSDGAVIGSKNFVESMALYHQNWLQKKHQPSAHPLSQFKNSTLFSLRPLRRAASG